MTIHGIVTARDGRGRILGFPTANVKLSNPVEWGVYAGYATVEGKRYPAAIFIGSDQLEAHLLDFFGDLYGKEMMVEIQRYIRGYQSFTSETKLIAAIQQDIKQIRLCLPA